MGFWMHAVNKKRITDFFAIRAKLIYITFLLVFTTILGRLWYLQVINHERLSKLELKQNSVVMPSTFKRRDIYDCNNLCLATDCDAFTIIVDREYLSDESIRFLSEELKVSPNVLKEKVGNNTAGIIKIGTYFVDQLKNIKRWPEDYSIGKRNAYKRVYPWGGISSSLIGVTGNDHVGLEGIEYLHNNKIGSSIKGNIISFRDALGRCFGKKVIGTVNETDNLKLNIDIIMATVLTNVLDRFYHDNKLESVFSNIVEIDANKLVADVSLPGYDPNDAASFDPVRMADRNLRQVFVPGSSLDVLLYLTNGYIAYNDLSYTDSGYNPYRVIASDATLQRVRSINKNMGPMIIRKGIGLDSLGSRINIDYAGQDKGLIPSYTDLTNIIINNHNVGDYAICNALQLQKLYVKAMFGSSLEPKAMCTPESIPTITNPKDINIENTLLSFTGPTNLGTVAFRENKTNKYINLVIGWFYASNKKYLLTVGAEQKTHDTNANIIKCWIEAKKRILQLEYKKPLDLVNGMKKADYVFENIRPLDEKYFDIKKSIYRMGDGEI